MATAVKRVFKNFELLGWYTVGTAVTSSQFELHKQVATFGSLDTLPD